MPRTRRGAYQHKIIPIEETALGRTMPPELREGFHRLLRSVWIGEAGAAETRRVPLDGLLDRLCTKPRCQLPHVFTTCLTAASTAMVERGREDARKDGRERMVRQHLLRERLTKAHREFQLVIKRPPFSTRPDSVATAQQRSSDFVEILSILSLKVSPSSRDRKGRPSTEAWRGLAHAALKLAGCSVRDITRLQALLRF